MFVLRNVKNGLPTQLFFIYSDERVGCIHCTNSLKWATLRRPRLVRFHDAPLELLPGLGPLLRLKLIIIFINTYIFYVFLLGRKTLFPLLVTPLHATIIIADFAFLAPF